MTAKIITIANTKGGVAKTTGTLVIAGTLKNKGYNVLVIDLDPQCNATTVSGVQSTDTIFQLLKDDNLSCLDFVEETPYFDIIAGSPEMKDPNSTFKGCEAVFFLKNAITPLIEVYDYIMIDTSKSDDILTQMALYSSTHVLIPINADGFALDALIVILDVIGRMKKFFNADLNLLGVYFNQYEKRFALTKAITEEIKSREDSYHMTVFDTKIRRSVTVTEAHTCKQTLIAYAPNAPVTKDFIDLTEEILKKINA